MKVISLCTFNWTTGLEGEIEPVPAKSSGVLLIRFPGSKKGHEGQGGYDCGECWWIHPNFLEFIPVPDPAVAEMVNDYVQDVQGG